MGATARVYGNPYKDDSVFFMVTDMISDFGISAFTHETTHVNDRMVYLGGWRHREGTDLEAYAQGMLQTPSVSNPNGEYKALRSATWPMNVLTMEPMVQYQSK